MTLMELQKTLSERDQAAVLVSARVMERVIPEACDVQGILWSVPHSKSFVADRSLLFQFVEQDDLLISPDRLPPETLILLAQPRSEDLSEKEYSKTLLKYWQRLFHANVHLILGDRFAQKLLTEEHIEERIDRIGQTEFEEIRSVLITEKYLFEKADKKEIYIEFVSVFLELKYFAPYLLPVYFPAIHDLDVVEDIISSDLDADALFERTRLEGAAEPVLQPKAVSDESHEYYYRLVRQAEKATEQGNIVKAAILRTRAARVAPAALTPKTHDDARANLKQLTDQLQTSVQLSEEESGELLNYLVSLLDKADQGRHPVEAALLYDLQRICNEFEQETYALDLVEWFFSVGKKPVKRPLPNLKYVQVIRHLRTAVQRLTSARLRDDERQKLSKLLHTALSRCEERLRNRFRPVITAVMEDVGLGPTNSPERISFNKLVEELLDQVIDVGFITFGDMRDALSRSQLKMPDLRDPQEFIRGDPLLRMDRRLSTLLDGVYRPGEVYMRWLQRTTSLNFGTSVGRTVTRYFTIPFGFSLVLIELIPLIWATLKHLLFHESMENYKLLIVNAVSTLSFRNPESIPISTICYWALWAGLSAFMFCTIHVPGFRKPVLQLWMSITKVLYKVFVKFPVWLFTLPSFRHFLSSWTAQLFYWYVLKPLVLTAIVLLFFLNQVQEPMFPVYVIGIFLGANLLLNSHTGMRISESVIQGTLNLLVMLRSGLLAGIYHFILYVFKQISRAFDLIFLTVDSLLSYRKGDSEFSLFLRTLTSLIWAPFSFVIRFFFLVLIEPMVNPLKLPICFIAAKILYPIILNPGFIEQIVNKIEGVTGSELGYFLVGNLLWLAPNLFGFLIWEIKENWSLYRSNRPRNLQPMIIGGHGETMRRYLQPGFHSGTIPKHYQRLRHAERNAVRSENWRSVRSARQALDEVREEIRRFVEREMLSLLQKSKSWSERIYSEEITEHDTLISPENSVNYRNNTLRVGQILLASNRIDIQLDHDSFPNDSMWIRVECRNNWLIANLFRKGWLNRLSGEKRAIFMSALACLYKYCGIDLVQEQIEGALQITNNQYDIVETGLSVWEVSLSDHPVLYDLRAPNGILDPTTANGELATDWPKINAQDVIFARTKLSWEEFVSTWDNDKPEQLSAHMLGTDHNLLGDSYYKLPQSEAVMVAENQEETGASN